jgi:four helix bundle protein
LGIINSNRDLVVWQKAMRPAKEAYQLAKLLPKQEEHRLTNQLLRAVASVPTNIAEGHARGTRKEYANYISIARGSLAETETILLLLVEVELITSERAQPSLALCSEISRMLNALRTRLRETPQQGSLEPGPSNLKPEFDAR